jgi:hypothetical protein
MTTTGAILATMSGGGRSHGRTNPGGRAAAGPWRHDTLGQGQSAPGDARAGQDLLTASSLALPALDVIVEGDASKVTDHNKIQHVVDAYASKLHWPLTVRDGGVVGPNALTAGPPSYAVFELTPTTVLGLPGIPGTEEGEGAAGSFSLTRWRFRAATDTSAASTP